MPLGLQTPIDLDDTTNKVSINIYKFICICVIGIYVCLLSQFINKFNDILFNVLILSEKYLKFN